jgi:hypothetical protein
MFGMKHESQDSQNKRERTRQVSASFFKKPVKPNFIRHGEINSIFGVLGQKGFMKEDLQQLASIFSTYRATLKIQKKTFFTNPKKPKNGWLPKIAMIIVLGFENPELS